MVIHGRLGRTGSEVQIRGINVWKGRQSGISSGKCASVKQFFYFVRGDTQGESEERRRLSGPRLDHPVCAFPRSSC